MTRNLEEELKEALKRRNDLTPEQMAQLTNAITNRLEGVVQVRLDASDQKLENLSHRVDTLQASVDLIRSEEVVERHDTSDMKVNMAKVSQIVKDIQVELGGLPHEIIAGIKHNMNKQEDRLSDQIEEKVPNAVSEAVMESLEPKKDEFELKPVKKTLWEKIRPHLWRK